MAKDDEVVRHRGCGIRLHERFAERRGLTGHRLREMYVIQVRTTGRGRLRLRRYRRPGGKDHRDGDGRDC
jgi:hypothetical protein